MRRISSSSLNFRFGVAATVPAIGASIVMDISFRLKDQAALSFGIPYYQSARPTYPPTRSVSSKLYFDFQTSANRGIWSGIHWKF